MWRLLASVHHVISKSDPAKLGYTKLNNILWYSDLEHYRWHGSTITGLNHYERTPFGPGSKQIWHAIRVLIKHGKIAEREVAVDDIVRREMICLSEPDIPALNVEQISILNHAINVITALNASQLFQMIDQDRLWQEVSNNQAMLVSTGSVVNQRLPSTKVHRVAGLTEPNSDHCSAAAAMPALSNRAEAARPDPGASQTRSSNRGSPTLASSRKARTTTGRIGATRRVGGDRRDSRRIAPH